MGTTTAAGTKLAVSIAAPATNNAAGYGALTFTEVTGVEKIGPIGATYNKVEFTPLRGPKQKHKGSRDNGALAPSMAHDEDDAGQAIVRTASSSDALLSWEVTYPNGEIRYFRGRVFGYPENVDGADTILMAAPTIEIDTDIVKVPAP
jgi:hypothetical protein